MSDNRFKEVFSFETFMTLVERVEALEHSKAEQ